MKFAVLALIIYLAYAQIDNGKSRPLVKYECDCNTTYEKVFDGNFQNKNEYMQNPYVNCTDSVTRFVTTSVTINDTISLSFDDINSSAFEIPLKEYNFKIGDPIHIVVRHYGCGSPKMLNPEVR